MEGLDSVRFQGDPNAAAVIAEQYDDAENDQNHRPSQHSLLAVLPLQNPTHRGTALSRVGAQHHPRGVRRALAGLS